MHPTTRANVDSPDSTRVAPLGDTPTIDSSQLGVYRLIRPIGRGGMGQVWLAERNDGVYTQQVAVKIAAIALGDRDAFSRAAAERQFLAQLEHPNISRVIDGGTTASGQPYVVMEWIDGVAIDAYCEQQKLTVVQRVRLFLQVLAAVGAAHRALIVHRDLKPANILVTASGQVKLLDFGIAKAIGGRFDPFETAQGLSPMTPAYASPEQWQQAPITTATDVYALGLVLYKLLAGRLPADGHEKGLAAWLALQASDSITPLFERADAAALALAEPEFQRFRKQLKGDLPRIVQQCLWADPRRRYGGVSELEDDLQRWLAHEPVRARRGGRAYRLAKFVQRNAVLCTTLAMASLLLLGSVVLLLAERDRTLAERDFSRALQAILGDMLEGANVAAAAGKVPTVLDMVGRTAKDLEAGKYDAQPLVKAEVMAILVNTYRSISQQQQSFDLAEQRLAWVRQTLPMSSPVRADAEISVAFADFMRGRTAAADDRLRSYLPALEQAYADGAVSASRLALGYSVGYYSASARGDYGLGAALLTRSAAIEDQLGEVSEATAVTRGLLVAALGHQGKLREADAAAEAAKQHLDRATEAVVVGRAFVLAQQANVAGLLGDDLRAERAFTAATQALRDNLGDDSLWYADFTRLHADQHYRQGRYAEAADKARIADQIYRRTIGTTYVYYPQMQRTLGSLACVSGTADADELLSAALLAERERVPQNPLWLGLAELAQAECLSRRGDRVAAQRHARAAVASLQALGPDDPRQKLALRLAGA